MSTNRQRPEPGIRSPSPTSTPSPARSAAEASAPARSVCHTAQTKTADGSQALLPVTGTRSRPTHHSLSPTAPPHTGLWKILRPRQGEAGRGPGSASPHGWQPWPGVWPAAVLRGPPRHSPTHGHWNGSRQVQRLCHCYTLVLFGHGYRALGGRGGMLCLASRLFLVKKCRSSER